LGCFGYTRKQRFGNWGTPDQREKKEKEKSFAGKQSPEWGSNWASVVGPSALVKQRGGRGFGKSKWGTMGEKKKRQNTLPGHK